MMKTKFVESLFGQRLTNNVISTSRFLILYVLFVSFGISGNSQCVADDVEEPTVICRVLHTTFMPDTCMVEIWAKDMVTSVSDDKTPSDQLIVSFDKEGNEMSKILIGEDGFEQEVYIWVTDRCGKQTVCKTTVVINDNENNCVRRFFDLALRKTVNAATPGPFLPGSAVTFDIEVINQGNLDAFNIDLTDYIPTGLILNDSNWSFSGSNAVWVDAISSLPAGTSTTRTISFTISEDFEGTSIRNVAEIVQADDDLDPNNVDPVDDDSTPDADPNDPGADPNTGTDDTVNNENGDEDDHDPAIINIERYDLSIDKSVSSDGPFELGDLITYRITVNNEGSIEATDIEITDFPQTDALTFVSSNVNSEPNVSRINDFVYEVRSLSPGTSEAFEITFRINADYQGGEIMNTVEITGDDEEYEDVDSDPDTRKDTDDGRDDLANGDEDGNNDGPGDFNTFDDDEDMVTVPVIQIFDLALRKTSSPSNPTEIFEGDNITFNITVFNQGTLTATRIDLVDYIPDGLTLNDNDWILNGSTAVRSDIMDTPLLPGESTVVPITFTVATNTAGTILNFAEISRGDNPMGLPDCDSDPDSINDDNVIDDRVDSGKSTDFERSRDEDDHDQEPVVIQRYDLALDKNLVSTGPYELGDAITYEIVVRNEGSINATDIIVTDFPQSNALTFVSSNATSNSNISSNNDLIYTVSSLNAGESETISLTFTINESFGGDEIMNIAEITSDDEEYEDVDSDPDTRKDTDDGRDDVANGDEDGNNDGPGDFNTFDDDEDMVTLTVDRYDLAIDKTTLSTAPYLLGDTVTFEIEVTNQGSLDAALIEVTDFPQNGLIYVDDNVGTNGNITGTASNYVVLSLPSGASEKFEIRFRIDDSFSGTELMNIVEITKDDGDDVDSDPDRDKDTDDGRDGTNDGNDDDEDMEVIQVDHYDLALMKVEASSGPYATGDDVTYSIMVINQGTLPSGNVTVTDYLPNGMTLSSADNNGWSVQSGNRLSNTISNIAASQTETLSLVLTIDENFSGTSIINWAEISSDSGDDIDSTPDDTNFNQSGETNDLADDNVKDEDGQNGRDEDDHDPAQIMVDRYDLALMKVVNGSGPFRPGDNVTYSIMVINQGTLPSGVIEVTDYLPTGMTLSNSDNNGWTVGTNGRLKNTINNIAGGSTATINLVLRIDDTFRGSSLRNWAEISSDSGDDQDSTPDDTNFNQPGETDDLFDDDIKDQDGTNNGDEDDHDPAEIAVVYYDLAIMKTVTSTGPFGPTDDVSYSIMVINQGTEASGAVTVTDYLPANMSLSPTDNNGWTLSSGKLTNTISNIPVGGTETIDLVLRIANSFTGGRITNWAEISSDSGDDVDSTPDDINFNQPGETDDLNDDDVKNEDGTNGGDEDDHDPAVISVLVYDLALTKVVNGNGPFQPGTDISYTITVINQGDVASGSVSITDYLPTGTTLSPNDNNGWVVSGSNVTKSISNILAGQSSTNTLVLRIDENFTGSTIRNWAEISSDSGVDIDSTPDDTNFNQPGETNDLTDDNVVNQDGTNGGDEDDHDPAEVTIDFYDLALRKVSVGNGPFQPGQDVTFNITVLNQGTLPSGAITITDYIPAGMSLSSADNNGWVAGTGNRVSRNITNVTASNSITVPLVLTISQNFTGSTIRNWAEISSDSGDDIDSTPDATNFNQSGETDDLNDDNVVNQDGTDGGDEDDHDPAQISIVRYDLAIMKMVANSGPFEPGDDVSYSIMVINQGTLASGSVTVTDYVPVGMSLSPNDNNGWAASGSNLTNTINNIAIGQTRTLNLILRISNEFRGSTLRNWVEISSDSGNDVDSTPDGINFNQPGETNDLTDDDVKDENGRTGGDEDDHDPAQITVDNYDLALRKELVGSGPFQPNAEVSFNITVINQGTLPSGAVTITDYLPAELSLSVNDNNGWSVSGSGQLSNTITNIAPGSSRVIPLVLTLADDLTQSASTIRNWAEISSDSGDDIDSTPDSTNFNQDGETDDLDDDNVINEDGNNGGDEDDHDPVEISIINELCFCPDEPFIGQAVVTCAGGAFSNEAVAAILDLRNANTAPLGDDWAAPATSGATTVGIRKPGTWTIDNLGQVFGTSLGRTNGDIYLAATNVYAYDGDPFTPSGVGPGGEQGLYKANFANPGSVTSLVTTTNTFVANPVGTSIVPGKRLVLNGNNPLPTGWGNIAYDEMSNTLYGTNLSDGRIYAINATSGIILQVYDPFGQATGFLSNPLPANETLWAIELNECTRQLFFQRQRVAGGGEDLGDDGGVRRKDIYSIDIDNTGTIDPNSLQLQLAVNVGTREKLPDIDFNTSCDRMLMAERGTVHNSLTMLYELDGSGNWNLVTDITMGSLDGVDPWEMGLNSSGGVAFGSDQAANGMCDTILWSMGDCLDPDDVFGECNVYGPQGAYYPASDPTSLSGSLDEIGIYIDVTPEFNIDPRFQKFGLGDIEVFSCCCPPNTSNLNEETAEVAGTFITNEKVNPSGFTVDIESSDMEGFTFSDQNGSFEFKALEMHNDYMLMPSKEDEMVAGVTTLDLVLIEQHLLGLKEITNPKLLVAADIDNSGSINAVDIIKLREVLLGKSYIEPTTEAWRFITTDSEMNAIIDDMTAYSNHYMLSDLDRSIMTNDFYAIKVGDINESLNSAQSRSNESIEIYVHKSKDQLQFVLSSDIQSKGFQLSMVVGDINEFKIDSRYFDINSSNFNLIGDELLISINSSEAESLTKGDVLFTLQADNLSDSHLIQSGSKLRPEIYSMTNDVLVLNIDNGLDPIGYSLGQNNPNPFSEITTINFAIPSDQNVTLSFFAMDGTLLYRTSGIYTAGSNSIIISKQDLDYYTGTVIYNMITDEYSASGRLISID